MKIFILTGSTESGDDIGPYAWLEKPTVAMINDVFLRDIPEEVEADCISSYRVEEVTVEGAG
jgi:hypothetical protein